MDTEILNFTELPDNALVLKNKFGAITWLISGGHYRHPMDSPFITAGRLINTNSFLLIKKELYYVVNNVTFGIYRAYHAIHPIIIFPTEQEKLYFSLKLC